MGHAFHSLAPTLLVDQVKKIGDEVRDWAVVILKHLASGFNVLLKGHLGAATLFGSLKYICSRRRRFYVESMQDMALVNDDDAVGVSVQTDRHLATGKFWIIEINELAKLLRRE